MKRVDVVYVLLFDENNENVLMVKNKGIKESYYTLPGGAVEQGQTLKEAAIREVKEETGLDVKVDGIFTVSEAFFKQKGHHAIFFTFFGEIVGGEINILYPEEIEEVIWMEKDLAEDSLHNPEELKGVINNNPSTPYIFRGKLTVKTSQNDRTYI
ncbi:NUDIX hydrolase [Piscibacillus sp. B03]|uniref:NUDIX hydrolase n=1 Tax=Piscibacillus sp. B03 TaxID=3457430 RepID=UPI003FCDF145